VEHRVWDATASAGSRRWQELGRPSLPALVVDGEVTPLFHVSQMAAALGLPCPDGAEWLSAGWDIAAVLRAWCDHLDEAGFELALEPTPSRGRTLRNLTVNVFRPLELLAGAEETGRFDWDPDLDDQRERRLTDGPALSSYARRAAGVWHDFLLSSGESPPAGVVVGTPRGEIELSALVASQRWHAAYHYRQMVEFLRGRGLELRDAVPPPADIGLPGDVF
jgi:hypothetical protein